ncbi:hypothetical protein FRC07_013824, partial [Ceratobasidium sp. 392]
MFLDVACRFVSVASPNRNEDILVTTTIYTMRNIAAMFGAVELFPNLTSIPNPGVATVSDAMTVVRHYVTRLSSGPPDLKLWFHLYEWASGFVRPDMSDLMLPFFRVSYAGLWSILDPTNESLPMTADRICDLVDYGGQVMVFTGIILDERILTRRNKDALLEIVRQSDIFALLARIMFLCLIPKTITLTQKDKKNLGELYYGLLLQIPQFGNTVNGNCQSSSELFKRSYPDWVKVTYYFQERCFAADRNTLTHKHLLNC